MKLKVGKKQPARTTGRQRQTTLDRRPQSAFSYHAQRSERDEANSGRQASLADQRHKMLSLQFWAKRSGLLIAVIVAVICAVSILSLSSQPRIVLLDATGSGYAFHEVAEYQKIASEHLSSSVWNKNKITVNTGAASTALKQKFPELASVSVTLPLIGHRPIYYLHANAPAFVMQTVNGTFVLDSAGKALIAKDAAPATVVAQLPVITDQTGIHARLGKQIISSSEATFIRTVVNTLTAKQVSISSLALPANAVQQLDVRVNGQPYVIKFSMHDPTTARQQVGTYLATINTLAGQKVTPAQYIDVRVLGRAYYQ